MPDGRKIKASTRDGLMDKLYNYYVGGISDLSLKSVFKAALAEKYQSIYAQLTDKAFEDYSYGQGAYEELLEQQDYEICKNVWSKIDMGNITLDHESAYNNKNQ